MSCRKFCVLVNSMIMCLWRQQQIIHTWADKQSKYSINENLFAQDARRSYLITVDVENIINTPQIPMIEFFMPMKPPTTTAQMHKVSNGNFYDPPELKAAKAKLMAHLAQHAPTVAYAKSVRLYTKWLFPVAGKHKDGEYKYTRPDTDNLQKMLKDCMTKCGYWKDDALVASEVIEKFWAEVPGIYIRIEELI